MNRIVPWAELMAVIEPVYPLVASVQSLHYPNQGRGREGRGDTLPISFLKPKDGEPENLQPLD